MVRIYIAAATMSDEEYEAMLPACSIRRQNKVRAIRTAADKKRSVAAAMALDRALQSVGMCEYEAEIACTAQGKPYLPANPEICFSLSHAGEFAVCAIADRQIGVDLEAPRNFSESLKKRCFRAAELASAEPLRLWVLKESYGKMTGHGLAVIDSLELEFEDSVRVRERTQAAAAAFWEVKLPGDYHLAVCCEGTAPITSEIIRI